MSLKKISKNQPKDFKFSKENLELVNKILQKLFNNFFCKIR